MTEEQIYRNFIGWLGQAWYGLPESEYLMPLIQKEAIVHPPENVREYGLRFMGDAQKGEPLLRK